jgi:hypothetical protein
MQVWRNCHFLSEETSGLICLPTYHVFFKVCSQLWTGFFIFHISIRIHEGFLCTGKHTIYERFNSDYTRLLRDYASCSESNPDVSCVWWSLWSEATPEKYFLLPHNQKENDYHHIPLSQNVILQMNGHQELSSETPYTSSSSEPCEISKSLVRLHQDKRKCLYQKQVSVLLRNKLHYFQHSCIAGMYNALDVMPLH